MQIKAEGENRAGRLEKKKKKKGLMKKIVDKGVGQTGRHSRSWNVETRVYEAKTVVVAQGT